MGLSETMIIQEKMKPYEKAIFSLIYNIYIE